MTQARYVYSHEEAKLAPKRGWKRASWEMMSAHGRRDVDAIRTDGQTEKHIPDKEIYNNLYLSSDWMARHACTFPVLLSFNITHLWTLKPDGCTVINNVFPLWAIKYSVSGSLGWSGELKGASIVVVEGRGIFGTQNFPSSLKQNWVVTHHRMMVLFCLPVMWWEELSHFQWKH